MKTIKVFIASSEELKLECLEFTDIIQQLNRILKPRGLETEPVKRSILMHRWASYTSRRNIIMNRRLAKTNKIIIYNH